MNLFIIKAANNSKENFYVSGISLKGKPWDKNYIIHPTILKGGEIKFSMTNSPNKSRRTSKSSYPYSMTIVE
jgi:putative alpha-1,2-mannosidase